MKFSKCPDRSPSPLFSSSSVDFSEMSNLNLIAIRDGATGGKSIVDFYSPAKEKATNMSAYSNRPTALRRLRKLINGAPKVKFLLFVAILLTVVLFASKIDSLMSWNLDASSSVSYPSKDYTSFAI